MGAFACYNQGHERSNWAVVINNTQFQKNICWLIAVPSGKFVLVWVKTCGNKFFVSHWTHIEGDTKKRELLKNPTKIVEIQEKKFIYRNSTIKTCLLRDSNPNYQCLKITSCRWRPPPRMHSFTATTHFRIQNAQCDSVTFCRACNTHRVTQKNGNFWNE